MATKKTTKKNTTPNTKKKKTTQAKSVSAPRRTRTSAQREADAKALRQVQQDVFVREIIHWVSIAFCLILFLSLFGLCGVVGTWFQHLLFGCFGLMAYLAPFLLYYIIRFILERKGRHGKWRVLGSLLLLFFSLCGLIQLLTMQVDPSKISVAYKAAAVDPVCGGISGLLLVRGLDYLFGEIGAYIVFVLLVIIGVVLLSNRSLWNPLQEKSRQMAAQAREAGQRRKRANTPSHREQAEHTPGIDFSATDLKRTKSSAQTEEQNAAPAGEAPEEAPISRRKRHPRTSTPDITLPAMDQNAQLETPKTESTGEFHIYRGETQTEPVAELPKEKMITEPAKQVSGADLMAQEQEN